MTKWECREKLKVGKWYLNQSELGKEAIAYGLCGRLEELK